MAGGRLWRVTLNHEEEKNEKSSSEPSETSEPSEPPETQISYVRRYERLISFRRVKMKNQKQPSLTPERSEPPVSLLTPQYYFPLPNGERVG